MHPGNTGLRLRRDRFEEFCLQEGGEGRATVGLPDRMKLSGKQGLPGDGRGHSFRNPSVLNPDFSVQVISTFLC